MPHKRRFYCYSQNDSESLRVTLRVTRRVTPEQPKESNNFSVFFLDLGCDFARVLTKDGYYHGLLANVAFMVNDDVRSRVI
jgi:hypothetical protein